MKIYENPNNTIALQRSKPQPVAPADLAAFGGHRQRPVGDQGLGPSGRTSHVLSGKPCPTWPNKTCLVSPNRHAVVWFYRFAILYSQIFRLVADICVANGGG